MSDIVLVAMVAAIPGVLTAISSWRNGRKLDTVHVLVNSNLTKVKDDLTMALDTISELKAVIQKREA